MGGRRVGGWEGLLSVDHPWGKHEVCLTSLSVVPTEKRNHEKEEERDKTRYSQRDRERQTDRDRDRAIDRDMV